MLLTAARVGNENRHNTARRFDYGTELDKARAYGLREVRVACASRLSAKRRGTAQRMFHAPIVQPLSDEVIFFV